MAYRVRIFLRHPDDIVGDYMGEKSLPEPPQTNHSVKFEHNGGVTTGTVERISPIDWIPESDLVPTVYVVQDFEA